MTAKLGDGSNMKSARLKSIVDRTRTQPTYLIQSAAERPSHQAKTLRVSANNTGSCYSVSVY